MTQPRCALTELPQDSCAHCRATPTPPGLSLLDGVDFTLAYHRPETDVGPPVLARYDGWCSGCGEQIQAGDDLIVASTGGGWVHQDCV